MGRISVGPVFVYEAIAASRRRSTYGLRSALVATMLVGLLFVFSQVGEEYRSAVVQGRSPARFMAMVGNTFAIAIAGAQLTLLLLAAPAATAGAFARDRARGSLQQLLTTDLGDREIVLGTLAGRLAPLLAMIAAGLPVLALCSLLGGVAPASMLGLVALSVAVGVLMCSLSLALSARLESPQEVLAVAYAAALGWVVGPLLYEEVRPRGFPAAPGWLHRANPYALALGPHAWPNWSNALDVLWFVVGCLLLSTLLVGLTIAGLRREPRRVPRRAAMRDRRFGPGLDRNPVLWREWHRTRPSAVGRALRAGFWIGSTVLMMLGIFLHLDGQGSELIDVATALHVGFGLLLLSASAPASLAEERGRGSLDVLLSTPLSTRSVVLGKWLGAFRVVPWLAILPTIGATTRAVRASPQLLTTGFRMVDGVLTPFRVWTLPVTLGDRFAASLLPGLYVLALGAAFTSLGLALANWIRRPDRALAASVSTYLLWTFGWWLASEVFEVGASLGRLFVSGEDVATVRMLGSFNNALASLSPLATTVAVPLRLSRLWDETWLGAQAVLFAFLLPLAASALLLVLTLRTFDGCLGRVGNAPAGRRRRFGIGNLSGRSGRPVQASSERYASASSPLR